ncbi:hypothetical protein P7D22_13945 [Lichenihabitans sp. Uapishka_5]|uniref:hypothetical protein n=1 Tax=Lichenihabitans sp. Uapishka_5 TaxID=3037302 RepID=UPI0029E82229|nr:hypothetical protein [Lichenihabitans sp. Uapishka_5]MDX7952276.1 hypothetical protein [Lichenihabitans sp. Uapishka_5]
MAKLSPKSVLRDTFPASPLDAVLGKRKITKEDVAALRRSDLGLGLRSRAEAEAMLAIERGRGEKCRAWGDLLVELLSDFVVWDQRPSGILTEDTATWLSDQVGETPTPACLALLMAVMDDAETVPAWFVPAVRLRASKVFGRQAIETLRQDA